MTEYFSGYINKQGVYIGPRVCRGDLVCPKNTTSLGTLEEVYGSIDFSRTESPEAPHLRVVTKDLILGTHNFPLPDLEVVGAVVIPYKGFVPYLPKLKDDTVLLPVGYRVRLGDAKYPKPTYLRLLNEVLESTESQVTKLYLQHPYLRKLIEVRNGSQSIS